MAIVMMLSTLTRPIVEAGLNGVTGLNVTNLVEEDVSIVIVPALLVLAVAHL